MTVKTSSATELRATVSLETYGHALREGIRYLGASAVALAADAGTYVALIRGAGIDYLVAAPASFMLGLLVIYFFSTRWVFACRRLKDARVEFAVFATIGLIGLCLNQLVIYAGVAHSGLSAEAAKLASVSLVFGFNFVSRKLLLFTGRA
jgi:putative flippase GtrA